jgi:hypothetical protein
MPLCINLPFLSPPVLFWSKTITAGELGGRKKKSELLFRQE